MHLKDDIKVLQKSNTDRNAPYIQVTDAEPEHDAIDTSSQVATEDTISLCSTSGEVPADAEEDTQEHRIGPPVVLQFQHKHSDDTASLANMVKDDAPEASAEDVESVEEALPEPLRAKSAKLQ